MLITAFAKRADLSVDTVRYYVRRGLLKPELGQRGGRNPYQEFSAADLDAASIIRTGQALGLGLKDIAEFLADYRSGRHSPDNLADFLTVQRYRLLTRASDLQGLAAFLDAKIGWLADPDPARQPCLDDFSSTKKDSLPRNRIGRPGDGT